MSTRVLSLGEAHQPLGVLRHGVDVVVRAGDRQTQAGQGDLEASAAIIGNPRWFWRDPYA